MNAHISWQRTPDRRVWRASATRRVLTVTQLSNGHWLADIEGDRSPEFATRLAAQRWAERSGGAR